MDRNDRALTAFAMIGHATFHTYELVIPIFVAIWLEVFLATPATLGLVVGAGYALVDVGALPSGVLADRVSSKRLVVGCLVGMGIGFLVISAAPTIAVLTVGLLLWGGAASLYHPAGLTLISRGAKARGTAFAYHGAAGNLGVATGPLLGAILLSFVGWRAVAALLVVPLVIAVVVAVRLEFDETAGSAARRVEAESTPPRIDGQPGDGSTAFLADTRKLFVGAFFVVFLIGNLYGLYYRGAFTFLPDILASIPRLQPIALFGRPVVPNQYVYSGLLLLGGVGQYAGGRLVDCVPAERALVGTLVALAILAIAFVPAANAGLGPLLVVAGLLGFVVFMEAPINQEVISRHVPAGIRGLSFGYTYVAVFGVGAAGAWLAGAILTWSTSGVLFAVLAGFALVGAALGGLLIVRWGRPAD